MAVSLADLYPHSDAGGLPIGTWHIRMTDPVNEHLGGVHLREGKTVEPINGRRLRRMIGAMGHRIVSATRVEDGVHLGEDPLGAFRARLWSIYERAVAAGLQDPQSDAAEMLDHDMAQLADADFDDIEKEIADTEERLAEAIEAKQDHDAEEAAEREAATAAALREDAPADPVADASDPPDPEPSEPPPAPEPPAAADGGTLATDGIDFDGMTHAELRGWVKDHPEVDALVDLRGTSDAIRSRIRTALMKLD